MRTQRDSKALRHVLGLALIGLILPASASAADLSVSLGRSPNRVYVGDLVAYSVAVSNSGPETAPDVTVRFSAPTRAGMLKASASRGGCLVRRSAAICDLAALEPAGVAEVEVIARPIASGEIASVARVPESGPSDPDPSNDVAEDVTTVHLSRDPCSSLRLGTRASNRLDGTAGGDAIFGRRGDDTILGGDRDDCLSGQEGDDTLFGGEDADTLFGDAGADILDGGPGDDDLARGGRGPDRITDAEEVIAGSGDDHIVAPAGALVRCGDGQDFVRLLGTATLSGCEQTAGPPPPPPSTEPAPAPVTGGGEPGRVRRRGSLRTRGKHCRRRHCPRGGPIGGNTAAFSSLGAPSQVRKP